MTGMLNTLLDINQIEVGAVGGPELQAEFILPFAVCLKDGQGFRRDEKNARVLRLGTLEAHLISNLR